MYLLTIFAIIMLFYLTEKKDDSADRKMFYNYFIYFYDLRTLQNETGFKREGKITLLRMRKNVYACSTMHFKCESDSNFI